MLYYVSWWTETGWSKSSRNSWSSVKMSSWWPALPSDHCNDQPREERIPLPPADSVAEAEDLVHFCSDVALTVLIWILRKLHENPFLNYLFTLEIQGSRAGTLSGSGAASPPADPLEARLPSLLVLAARLPNVTLHVTCPGTMTPTAQDFVKENVIAVVLCFWNAVLDTPSRWRWHTCS